MALKVSHHGRALLHHGKRRLLQPPSSPTESVPKLVTAWHGSQFARHEMVGRPGSRHRNLAVLEMPGGCGVAVLIFGYSVGINQVGEIDKHLAGFHAFAD